MIVRGIDFTSNPTEKKPLTCAECDFDGAVLRVRDVRPLPHFEKFEELLNNGGSWIAGIDFPFGQSQKMIVDLGWPLSWESYIGLVARMSPAEFYALLNAYKAGRPYGDREHRRCTDKLARSISPQRLHFIPVGRMFYKGAQRLLASPAAVLPVRPAGTSSIVVEAYPALVARLWAGGYKSDTRQNQTVAHERCRRLIVAGLVSPDFRSVFGFRLELPEPFERPLVADPTGDQLDAVLCAVQAAWAYSQRDFGYGIPGGHVLEGWIAHPLDEAGRYVGTPPVLRTSLPL